MKNKFINQKTENSQFIQIKDRRAFIFYLITYFLTGILFLASMLLVPIIELPLYLLAPAIVALIMIGITEKRNGINNLFKRFVPQKGIITWLFISVALSVLISFACDIVLKLTTKTTINYNTATNSMTISTILIILIGAFGEELGWRGYLLPLLSHKYNNLISSLIIGVLWGIWHAGDYGEGIGFLLFVISTIEFSIMMTWLYSKSNKNWFTSFLFHSFFNLSNLYIGTEISLRFRIVSVFVYAIPVIFLLFFSTVFKKADDTSLN